MSDTLVDDYLRLGLALDRHVEGLVDSYYGPPHLAERAAAGPPVAPAELVDRARRLLSSLMVDRELDAPRRRWLVAQVRGLHVTAQRLAGEPLGYLDEIEGCYEIRPSFLSEDDIAQAHKRLNEVVPGTGPLGERYSAWREAQAVDPELLPAAVESLAEDFRERTRHAFGLPEGEAVEFVMESGKPWNGFNYYLGSLRSRVAINLDLPVLSPALGKLVAHETYPGHHTEHCRKEAGLVRRHRQLEETIFLVGTPQCLVAEGLADLGIEVILGDRPERVIAEHLRPLGIPYDPDVSAEVAVVGEVLGAVRGNAAILIHDRGSGGEEAVAYLERWALLSHARASKQVEFLIDPTWRAYPFCYIDGVRLCRQFVGGRPDRFERLISEQLPPSELVDERISP